MSSKPDTSLSHITIVKSHRNVNNKLVDQVTRFERKCWENEQYSRREFIEISGIPQSIKQMDLEKTVLNDFDKIDAPVDPQNIEVCHKLMETIKLL